MAFLASNDIPLIVVGCSHLQSQYGILETPQDYRNRMAELAFKAWYYPLFHHQIIHGDPHLGNYSFRQESLHGDEGINLFDFGCVRQFEKPFLQGVKDLYHRG